MGILIAWMLGLALANAIYDGDQTSIIIMLTTTLTVAVISIILETTTKE